jgi:putative heme iron utilization protein
MTQRAGWRNYPVLPAGPAYAKAGADRTGHRADMAKSQTEIAELAKKRLLDTARTLILTAVDETGQPCIGTAPFFRKNGIFYIFSSELSEHIKAILKGAHSQFMLLADEQESQNIWARQRLSFRADIEEISRTDPDFDRMCAEIGARHGPVMDVIKPFRDFHLLKITPTEGRLVTGFAAAFAVSGPQFDMEGQIGNG